MDKIYKFKSLDLAANVGSHQRLAKFLAVVCSHKFDNNFEPVQNQLPPLILPYLEIRTFLLNMET